MDLRDVSRCTAQDPDDLLILAERLLGRSKASLLVEGLGVREAARVLDRLLEFPRGYPMPYIVGEVDFYGRRFYVDDRVLVPRSETEGIVDIVLGLGINPKRIVDVGTGSGVIGITLKKEFPNATVVLTDISPEALKVARVNAERHRCEVLLVATDLLSGIKGKYDLIVSNPPYLPRDKLGVYDRRILYEPRKALLGGEKGYEITLALIEQAMAHLRRGGILVVESDPQHFDVFPKTARFIGRFAVIEKV